ncbi:hypothetical protein MNEG_4390 [Monoraphidium neglectum]|jgi:hypothetical protein|uniref:Uncharacterized protein n=1 Tax=Monoraphidium neglectum TaxID=145388 RepID=A0A0D2L9V8_9CHLO|nr:hypothetical protein MNEG_4390 [Monoraphidium neglectum]KIZ03564.1 hypothetical protein MNEG_4390 [Monoraphidium neglectum]|eukprot:XP_013902583.1 hypothetical protein MNEG_4390 [Monoraphidium neglectum]
MASLKSLVLWVLGLLAGLIAAFAPGVAAGAPSSGGSVAAAPEPFTPRRALMAETVAEPVERVRAYAGGATRGKGRGKGGGARR